MTSGITPQMRVFVFALEVFFAGINVSFVSVFEVVLSFIFGHGITSLVDFLVVGVPSCLIKIYVRMGKGQCEPVGWLVIGESYQPVSAACICRLKVLFISRCK